MDIIAKLSEELRVVKQKTGAMPRVLFVDAPVLHSLTKEMGRRGSPPNSKTPKLLGVPVKAFEFTADEPDETNEDNQDVNFNDIDGLVVAALQTFMRRTCF